MKTIHKFGPLRPLAHTDLLMPAGSEALSFGAQGHLLIDRTHQLFVWAVVNPDNELTTETFLVTGTGQPLKTKTIMPKFLGTVEVDGFVWHCFHDGPVRARV